MMNTLEIPFIDCKIPAGFPSPAQDWAESRIDLNEMLVKSPSSTFLFRVSGDSMVNAGIMDDSLLLVDRAEMVTKGCVVIASVNGDFTVKRYMITKGIPVLHPENPSYRDIPITEDTEIWGVVTAAITQCMRW